MTELNLLQNMKKLKLEDDGLKKHKDMKMLLLSLFVIVESGWQHTTLEARLHSVALPPAFPL